MARFSTARATPSIRRMASTTKLLPVTLETKGKLREARRLHSMTFTSLCLARNCTLNGPVIAQRLGQRLRDLARLADGRDVERLRREHQRRVAAVDAGVLDVLADGPEHDLAVVGHRVDLDLAGVRLELGDHHRVLGRDRLGARSRMRASSFGSWATLIAAPEST